MQALPSRVSSDDIGRQRTDTFTDSFLDEAIIQLLPSLDSGIALADAISAAYIMSQVDPYESYDPASRSESPLSALDPDHFEYVDRPLQLVTFDMESKSKS